MDAVCYYEPHQFLSKKKWNGQAPIFLFVKIYGQEAAERLGLEKIPSDSIHLTPALLKK